MNREAAKQEIRRSWKSLFYADRKGKGVICPLCDNGKGSDGDGITENPKKPGNLKCWKCGFQGDAIDLIMKRDNCDYNTALNNAAYDLGIKIDPYKPTAAEDFKPDYDIHNLVLNDNSWMNDTPKPPTAADREKSKAPTPAQSNLKPAEDKKPAAAANVPQKGAQEAAGESVADYTAYYEQCARNISDPAAASYLQARGISPTTAAVYGLGYDSAWISPKAIKDQRAKGSNWTPPATARIIIPVNKNHYIARAISPDAKIKKMNETGGGKTGIFNAQELYGDRNIIFIVEGVFDALSIIECGAAAVALNSTSNVHLFINHLKAAKQTRAAFVICLDNDDAGKRAADTLREELKELNIKCITADISGKFKDPNEALTGDREAFREAIIAALDRAKNATESGAEDAEPRPLPGLLTYTDAVDIFKNANDKILEMKSFPRFCKVAKIQTHATVALAADTGGGKSSLALNFLNDLNEEYPCIYINLEMDELIILRRLAAIHSGIELKNIEKYKQDEKTAAAVNISLKAITSRKPLQVIQGRYTDGEEEKRAYLLPQIQEIIERSTKDREETTIVIIDHSLLVKIQEDGSRYERFTDVSEKLREIALHNNIIMFILLQQNRAGKANEEERPKNSSLKESGSWENDATHICFLWYDPTDRKKKLILTKSRNGDSGEFVLNYWKKTQTYTEAAEQEQATKTASDQPHKPTKRERAQQKLKAAYEDAYINTFGKPTLRAMAEAADVTTGTIKTWLKEYGGCTIDGQKIDPAGIDTEVEYTGFIKLTPADNNPFNEQDQGGKAPAAVGNGQEVTAQF